MALAGLALALLHHVHDLAELADLEPGLAGEHLNLVAVLLDLVLVLGDEALPALGGEFRHPVEPARVELGALVVAQKILARDAMALGQPHQAALIADEALVDVVELLTSASMRAWLSRSDFTSGMMSSLSFLYRRSCAGESESLRSLCWMSWSCRRRSRL